MVLGWLVGLLVSVTRPSCTDHTYTYTATNQNQYPTNFDLAGEVNDKIFKNIVKKYRKKELFFAFERAMAFDRNGAFQPLSSSIRARGSLVVMDCRRRATPGYIWGALPCSNAAAA
jgi:hypothetical protein